MPLETELEPCTLHPEPAWQFGDWQNLAKIDRAKLALLAAAGRQQTGNNNEAQQFIRRGDQHG